MQHGASWETVSNSKRVFVHTGAGRTGEMNFAVREELGIFHQRGSVEAVVAGRGWGNGTLFEEGEATTG